MTTSVPIPSESVPELLKHLNEVLNLIQDADNALAAKVLAVPNLPPAVLPLLKEWSEVRNSIHAASDRFVIGLRGGRRPGRLQ